MSDTRSQEQPTVEAIPDIVSHEDATPTSEGTGNAPSQPFREDKEKPGNDAPATPEPVAGTSTAPSSTAQSTSPSPPSPSESSDTLSSPELATIPLPVEVDADEKWWDLRMSWSGKTYDIKVGSNDLVFDFRNKILELTNVPFARQKLVGLLKGASKITEEMDATRFGSLGVKDGVVKFTMIGTPEAQSFKDPIPRPDLDDFDVSYTAKTSKKRTRLNNDKPLLPAAEDPRNKRQVEAAIAAHPITIMNEPRPGKRLLVLDLDYTLVDTRPLLDGSLPAEECARPGMHDFLELVYPYYDIVIWSQTHWRWLESKLVELNVIGGDKNYKICFVADRLPMFPVFTLRGDNRMQKHEVKPLEWIWASYPQWGPSNTVHIDDLSRNFAMNPGEGLKIRAFKGAGTWTGASDTELSKLGPYLVHLAAGERNFTEIDHNAWKIWWAAHGRPKPLETAAPNPNPNPPQNPPA